MPTRKGIRHYFVTKVGFEPTIGLSPISEPKSDVFNHSTTWQCIVTGVGFEPTVGYQPTSASETLALNHSAIQHYKILKRRRESNPLTLRHGLKVHLLDLYRTQRHF